MHRLMRDASDESRVRAVMETSSGYDDGLWRQLAEMGVTGLVVSEEFGGSGVGPLELEAIMEEAGAAAERFLRLHPSHNNADYAWYMKALANYSLKPGVLSRFFLRLHCGGRGHFVDRRSR